MENTGLAPAIEASSARRLPLSLAEHLWESLDEGMQVWDAQGRLLFSNPAADRLFGSSADSGNLSEALLAARCSDANGRPLQNADCPVSRILHDQETSSSLLVQTRRDGLTRWLQISAYRVADVDGHGGPGAVSLLVDVSPIKEEGIDLQRHAYYDPLTRLPNRLLLADRMQLALAQSKRLGTSVAVCLMDLDGFKPVNDTLGHKAGDLLLQEISHRLLDVLRSDDTAARIGGDEFALLIGGLKSATQCEQTLHRILHAVEMPCLIEGHPVRVSASIGATVFPSDNADPDLLLRHADQAMYKAKEEGKGRISMFDPAVASQVKAKQGLLRKIEDGLTRNQFELHYQPEVDCRHGAIIGMEALIRWNHPVLGMRLPGEFLPLLEQDDLIVRLGEWTIAQALNQAAAWRAQGHVLSISVNVSARQFLKGDFAHRLGELLKSHAPETCRQLNIEIVETAALEDINAVSEVIESYQALGVRFALDDFGTGYSSLLHLKRLPANQLKIDQTFVRDMLDDPDDLAIVQGVIGLADAFQHQVVAEGVESIEQILMLLELGCDVMQGFGIARPMPASRVPEWIANFSADPRWRAGQSRYPARADFELLLMEVAHRHWMERMKSAIRLGIPLPSTAYADCRLAQWQEHAARGRHGRRPEFQEVDALHREVHRQAETLRACIEAGEAGFAEEATETLAAANRKLVDHLHAFRLTLPGTKPSPIELDWRST